MPKLDVYLVDLSIPIVKRPIPMGQVFLFKGGIIDSPENADYEGSPDLLGKLSFDVPGDFYCIAVKVPFQTAYDPTMVPPGGWGTVYSATGWPIVGRDMTFTVPLKWGGRLV